MLEELLAMVAPAAGGRTEALVHHVEVKAGNTVGKHLGEQCLDDVRVGRVETDEVVDGLAVGLAGFPFRVLAQLMGRILELAVRDDRQVEPAAFLDSLAQHVAITEASRLGDQLRVVEGEVAVPHPEHEVFGFGFSAAADNLPAVEVRGVAGGVLATGELGPGRAHFHAHESPAKPGSRVCRGPGFRRSKG
jgi:hypothetical protein